MRLRKLLKKMLKCNAKKIKNKKMFVFEKKFFWRVASKQTTCRAVKPDEIKISFYKIKKFKDLFFRKEKH